jgi:hypothetical protein
VAGGADGEANRRTTNLYIYILSVLLWIKREEEKGVRIILVWSNFICIKS